MAQMLLGQNPNVLNMFPGLQRLLPNTSLPSIPTITAQPTYQGKHFIYLVNFKFFSRKSTIFEFRKNLMPQILIRLRIIEWLFLC